MKKIVVVGDVMVDKWVHVAPQKISQEAPVLVVRPERIDYTLGGAGNVAVNIAHIGCGPDDEVVLMGIGRTETAFEGIAPSNVMPLTTSDMNWVNIEKQRFVSMDGHHLLRVDTEKHVEMLSEDTYKRFEQAILDQIVDADVVVVSDYGKGTMDPRIAATIGSAHRSKEFFMIVNPKPSTVDLYPTADVIVLNLQEAWGYLELHKTDIPHGPNFWDAMRSVGLRNENLIITVGDQGLHWNRVWNAVNAHFHFPAHEVKVADVTGAGDTIVATLAAYGRCDGVSLEAAAKNAASVVSQRGTSVPAK